MMCATTLARARTRAKLDQLEPIFDRNAAADVWRSVGIPKSRDIRHLLPKSLPRSKRFETLADVALRKRRLVLALEDLEPALAEAYDNCAPANPCSIPGCPYCDRLRRGYLFSETLRIYRRAPEPRLLVTVYLAAIPKGALPNVSIVKALRAFRKRLEREGVRGVMIGGTEAGWIAKRKSWILHLHILSMGVTRSEWDQVGDRMSNSDCAYPIKMRKIKNFSRPLSYMQKWVTYFRPHRRKGGKPSCAVPLKRRLVAELSRWWASHRFEDFMFIHGAKRRGGRVYVEPRGAEVGPVGSTETAVADERAKS